MVKSIRSMVFAAGMASAVLMLLSGCGRKADLDPPSMPAEQQNNRTAKPQSTAVDQPFILDPLL